MGQGIVLGGNSVRSLLSSLISAGPNEGKAFQAMLVRSLKFRDMAAVVQQENSPTSSLLRMSKWGCCRSALGVTLA
jgi:hypothetical protein